MHKCSYHKNILKTLVFLQRQNHIIYLKFRSKEKVREKKVFLLYIC